MPTRRKLLVFLFSATIFLFSSSGAAIAASFVFSGVPATIKEDETFLVNISLEGLTAGNKYYLRAVFSHIDSPTAYFGYTKNNSVLWYNGKPSPIDYTQFFQVTMNSDNIWSGSVEVKPDIGVSEYKGSGNYNFKIGRYTEAGSGPTWSDNVVQIAIVAVNPTSTPTSSPTSAPTPTPTSSLTSKAIYKINDAKDKDGKVLSEVKIYVDDNYTHHYAPETLTFCDGCHCDDDKNVDCGFGERKIKLEKSGYKDWSETKTINQGNSYEVNPVMELSESNFSPTPTPSSISPRPTSTPTPKVTPKSTPSSTLVATPSGEILGETEPSAQTPTPSSKNEPAGQTKRTIIAKIFLGLGLLILFGSAFALWYYRLR